MKRLLPHPYRTVHCLMAALVAASFGLVACSSSGSGGGSATSSVGSASSVSSTPTGGSASTGTPSDADKKQSLVVVWNSPPDVTYLPLLMAIKDLQQQGYNIKTETVSGADTATEALASNRAQFTSNQVAAEASAVAKGAPIKILLATATNPAVWVTTSQYSHCAQLSGKPVGIFGPPSSSSYTQLMDYYFKKFCPNVKPDLVTIPDSGLRAQALANGRIVASVLANSDAENLVTKLDPNHKYNVVPFSKTFPGIGDTYLYANTNVINSDPSAVSALITADLKSVRKIYQNPSELGGLIQQFYGSSTSAPSLASAQQSAKDKIWYANGGLGSAGLAGLTASLKVFGLNVSPSGLADAGPVNGVLSRIGRSNLTSG